MLKQESLPPLRPKQLTSHETIVFSGYHCQKIIHIHAGLGPKLPDQSYDLHPRTLDQLLKPDHQYAFHQEVQVRSYSNVLLRLTSHFPLVHTELERQLICMSIA